jgi:hypothetical protein
LGNVKEWPKVGYSLSKMFGEVNVDFEVDFEVRFMKGKLGCNL